MKTNAKLFILLVCLMPLLTTGCLVVEGRHHHEAIIAPVPVPVVVVPR